MATSTYLGSDDKKAANAKMLIGGAYDKAKVDGDLIRVPMLNPFDMNLSGGQTNSINVTSIDVFFSNGNKHTTETHGDKDVGVPVLLDTGVASWYLTDKTIVPIYCAFVITKEPPLGHQYFVVDFKPTRY